MVWVSIVGAHFIGGQLQHVDLAVSPLHVAAPGPTSNAAITAPWEMRCGKVYVRKVEGQPDQKSYRPCLIV